MLYQSTRGLDPIKKTFAEVLISSYASDGGLYIPESLPILNPDYLNLWSEYSFAEVTAEILKLYTDIELNKLREITKDAFKAFNPEGEEPIELVPMDDLFLLNLSLGPTLAFKDFGQQIIGQLLNYYLSQQGKIANIIVETSGDTGPAAVAGVQGMSNVKIICLYPHNRVSAIQELQMTTVQYSNVHIFRTEGNSDEQASVLKEIFNDKEFVEKYNICSVNSINWARIAIQSSFYIYLSIRIQKRFRRFEPIDVVVPSGAFGNAMGAYLAKLMGGFIHKIICATNLNDIVYRTISKGEMYMSDNIQTCSPAMDIQFAYNLERMLYYASNQNSTKIATLMEKMELQYKSCQSSEIIHIDHELLTAIQNIFESYSIDDSETLNTIASCYTKHNILLCPHSAIGVAATLHMDTDHKLYPTCCILTAHPAKFESIIERAVGVKPTYPIQVQNLFNQPTRYDVLNKGLDENWRKEWEQIIKAKVIEINQ